MAKKQPPGEPPPERPFGQVWPRDREPSSGKKASKLPPAVPTQTWATRMRRFVWRRMIRPFLVWSAHLIKRACDELLVFSLKAVALMVIVAFLGGSIVALKNYSLRQIVDTVVATLSKQHGVETDRQPREQAIVDTPAASPTVPSQTLQNQIETGSTHREPPTARDTQQASPAIPTPSPPAVARRRPTPPKEKPFFDSLIDRIDVALGWKKS